jgi:protein ImuA
VRKQSICLEELRERIARLEGTRRRDHRFITSGCAALDQMLSGKRQDAASTEERDAVFTEEEDAASTGGFRRGSLVEWLFEGEASGAGTLALLAARAASDDGRLLVVMDSRGDFFPPAAIRLGIAIEQLIVVRPQNAADHDWAMDQVLRSPVVAAVLAWPETLVQRTFRRWQLAAEEGGTLGLLLRPASARCEPSWADVRLLVEPVSSRHAPSAVTSNGTRSMPATSMPATRVFATRRLRITLLRCRGTADGSMVDVELDDETYRMHSIERQLQSGQCKLQLANG